MDGELFARSLGRILHTILELEESVSPRKQEVDERLEDQCKLKDTKRKSDDVMELYKEIFRLQTTIDEMNDHIDRLHRGEKCVYKWTYLHIEPQPNIVPRQRTNQTFALVTSAAEDALCDDSSPISQVVTEIIRT